MHGVPRARRGAAEEQSGPRFSVIAWGRRRALTAKNSSKAERDERAHDEPNDRVPPRTPLPPSPPPPPPQPAPRRGISDDAENVLVRPDDLLELVRAFVRKTAASDAKRSVLRAAAPRVPRVQHAAAAHMRDSPGVQVQPH